MRNDKFEKQTIFCLCVKETTLKKMLRKLFTNMGKCRTQYSVSWKLYCSVIQLFQKFYCFTVHFNSLNVTHQLMHFQYNNILV